MRDVTSVKRGEPVTVHTSPYVSQAGVFVALTADRMILVDHTVGCTQTPLGDGKRWVTDAANRVLTEPESVLPSIPPELE